MELISHKCQDQDLMKDRTNHGDKTSAERNEHLRMPCHKVPVHPQYRGYQYLPPQSDLSAHIFSNSLSCSFFFNWSD